VPQTGEGCPFEERAQSGVPCGPGAVCHVAVTDPFRELELFGGQGGAAQVDFNSGECADAFSDGPFGQAGGNHVGSPLIQCG